MIRVKWVFSILIAMAFVPIAHAQYERQSQDEKELGKVPFSAHSIDWEKQRYRASAVGAYDPQKVNNDKAQEQIRAKQMAIMLAQERLIMAIMGTRVSTGTSLTADNEGNEMEVSSHLLAKGVLEKVTTDSVQFFNHHEGGIFAVAYVSAPMISFNRLRKLAAQEINVKEEIDRIWKDVGMEQKAKMTKQKVTQVISQVSEELKKTFQEDQAGSEKQAEPANNSLGRYTGLIVNASHLRNKTFGLLARILTPSLRRVYGHEDVSRNIKLAGGMVWYTTSVEAAKKLPDSKGGDNLVGENPLVIDAKDTRAGNPSHLIVSEDVGSRVVAVGSGDDGFLAQARVVIVH